MVPMKIALGLLVAFVGLILPVAGAEAGHVHVAPHGGVLVEVGEHRYNVEFLFEAERGVMLAWVLDAHAEDFVRVTQPSFEVTARAGGEIHPLTFKAVGNAMTGETAGDSSQFEAPAEWLRTAPSFHGVVKEITVRGVRFADIAFDYPAAEKTP